MANDDKSVFSDKFGFSKHALANQVAGENVVLDDDELSIGKMARFARDAIPYAIAGALIAGVLAMAALFFMQMALPKTVAYRSGVVITMSGAEPGKYPNGAAFSLTDLRSPVVLEEVYNSNKVSDYNIRLVDFIGMVSIEPYSPAYNSVTSRFRARLENKTLTFEERKAIESEFNSALEGLGSKSILITLTVPQSTKIPDLVAQKIVDDIPSKWANIFIDRLGVANFPIPVSGAELINLQFLDDLDYPLAYDYLLAQKSKLQNQLGAIESLSGSISFVSAKSGKGIADLKREADTIDQFRLKLNLKPIVDQGLSRDPQVTIQIYASQINALGKDANVQSGFADNVSTIMSDFRNKGGAAGVSGSTVPPAVAGTQFDGAFVDKIIELSKQGAGTEFEQVLLKNKLEIENLHVSIKDQMARQIERRDAIANNTLTPETRKILEDRFKAGIVKVAGELNQLWTDSFAFMDELNSKRLNFDKALYRLSELPDDLRMEKPELLTQRSILIASALIMMGVIAGLFSFGWRRALKSR